MSRAMALASFLHATEVSVIAINVKNKAHPGELAE